MEDWMVKLIDENVEKTKQMEKLKSEIAENNAKIETELLRIIEDRNVKSTIVYASNGNQVMVTKPTKVELLNYEKLKKCLGEELMKIGVTREENVSYKISAKFQAMFANIILGDYMKEESLVDFLKSAFGDRMDSKQSSLLLKKLKGNYKMDRKVLVEMFGEADYDTELYHIALICNWKVISAYLPEEDILGCMSTIRDVMTASESIKIEYDYPGKK